MIRKIALAMTSMIAPGALAGQSITFDDKEQWETAVSQLGDFSTIDFTGMPVGLIEGDEYLDDFGVLFSDGLDQILGPICEGFPTDCFGLGGIFNIEVQFLSPQRWIAADYPGDIGFELYQGDTFIEEVAGFPGGGVGFFGGLISPVPFDRVVIFGPGGSAFIDNLHFGAPIVPAPSALPLSALALLSCQRRRHGCAA